MPRARACLELKERFALALATLRYTGEQLRFLSYRHHWLSPPRSALKPRPKWT